MLDNLIDEYVTILDRDPLDHSESTDVILEAFANKVIKATISNLGQDKYYKSINIRSIDYAPQITSNLR